jgi:16S rRNA (uracil1498-N3)-methyltransferase
MEYFFVEQKDVHGHELVLREDESRHLIRVLRKSVGDRIFATDGNDEMYEAIVKEIGKNDVRCDIAAMHRKYHEPSVDVTLAVSNLKNPARLEYLIEKATELGIRTLIPLHCERTIARGNKQDRLQKIALAAMKQCGRSWLPRIQPLQQFQTLVNNSAQWPLRIIPYEKTSSDQTLKKELNRHAEIHSALVVIGPEGGFSDSEMSLALSEGFRQVTLGSRRLRTETAALVVLTQLLT